MTDTTTEHSEPGQPLGLALTDLLGRAPWADDVEAWLEASSAEEIADDIDRYTMAEVARAVAVERERWRTLLADVNKQTRHNDYDWPACLQQEVDEALKA